MSKRRSIKRISISISTTQTLSGKETKRIGTKVYKGFKMIENNYFLENQDLQENFQSIVNWKEIIDGFEGDFEDHKEYQKTGKESLAMAPGSYEDALEYYKSIL